MAPAETVTLEKPMDQTPPVPEEPGGYRSVLKNKEFMTLWLGQIFSQLGDRIVLVIFIAVIAREFGANDSYNSFLYIAFTIPAILLTAIAGVFVDRWPRRGVLVSTNVLRALMVAFLPWAATGSLWNIYGLAFLLSSATQFFVPAEAATIPMIVRRNDLIAANAMFTTTMMASVIFGFALGDPLINIFSLKQVHWSIVGFFTVSSIILMFLKTPPLPESERKHTSVKEAYEHFIDDLKDGLHFIRDHRMVRNSIFRLATLFSGVVALCFMFITFAKEFLYFDAELASQKFGYIIAFSGLGMAAGGATVGFINHRMKRSQMVYGGFFAIGLCLMALCSITWIAPSMASVWFTWPGWDTPWNSFGEVPVTHRMAYTYTMATIMGIGASYVAIPLQSMIHELIPEDKRGKVLGVQFTVLSTCSTLPVVIAGLGTESFGVRPILVAIGITFVVMGLLGLYRRMKHPHVYPANW